MMKAFLAAVAGSIALTCAASPSLLAQSKVVSEKERLSVLERAQVWRPTKIAAMDLRRGPQAGAFAPGAVVNCEWVDKKFGGRTPKFGCRRQGDKEVLKVRYGRDNGEVYAGVAATRLLWALGFGADGLYPVRVICRGCPAELQEQGTVGEGTITFDVAAIERPFAGEDIESREAGAGWSWKELSEVHQDAGGASVSQLDALKLLAVMLQHSDNKPEQQRLVCLDGAESRRDLAKCRTPFIFIHDLGITFGRANLRNHQDVGSANFEEWSKTKVWRNAEHCVGNLTISQSGSLDDPVISEGGRRFLSDLLAQLTDGQLRDLFTVARFAEKPTGGAPIEAWVSAFKAKREEIASNPCR